MALNFILSLAIALATVAQYPTTPQSYTFKPSQNAVKRSRPLNRGILAFRMTGDEQPARGDCRSVGDRCGRK